MNNHPTLVILGCGFTGARAARLRLAQGGTVVATTRDPERARALRLEGIEAHAAHAISDEWVRAHVGAGAQVLVTLPPDGSTDERLVRALPEARCVYISTTGVYGERRGVIDASTPVDGANASPKAAARLAAEGAWRARGAVVLRAAGIYGPWRGLHRRVLEGAARIVGDGSRVVSRVHAEDLAMLCLRALEVGEEGATFPVGDDAPVGQGEVIAWLAKRLGVPLPPSVSASEVAETLRHDRSVDSAPARAALGATLRFPSYREGFEHCLAEEAL